MVLVCAPAGYGKSTLVAQWSDLDPRPSGWVQLGRGDNDPVVLLAHVVAALERTGPVCDELLEELSGRMPRIDEVAIPLLAADLGERDPFVLVLDDVHVITAERSRAVLAFLVDEVRSGCQLVLVTRGDPGVQLGRLRASGDLVEIGTALLALDPTETRDVAASAGLELSQAEAGALWERTEGWAAAVALATLALRGRDDGALRAAGLSGDQRQIADYLLEEVLERQPDHLKSFLLGTSILDRMTAPLCDAVLGTRDAADSLEDLARCNAFVVSLDDHRDWYRYHHLFRISSARSSSGATRRCSPCTSDGQQVGARGTDRLARRSPTRMRPAISLTQAESRLRTGTSSQAAGRSRACGSGLIAAPTRRSSQTRSCRSRPRGCSGFSARRPERGGSSLRPSGLRSTWHPPTGHLRFARHSRASEAPWLRTASRRCCAMLSSASRLRRRWARNVLSAPVAPWVRRTFSWASRRRQSPCCASHSRFRQTGPSSATLGSSRWAIWSSRLQSWAIGETRNDGSSKRAGWSAQQHLHDTIYGAIAYAAGALAHNQRGDHSEAARQLENVRRLRPLLRAGPWLNADLALRCADISLDLGDVTGALEHAQVAGDVLQGYPDAGTLPARLQRLQARIRRGEDYGFTPAELRLVAFLRTHLSLQDIADRLHLARPTVKTHVASIYGKLGVTSRSDAVEVIEQAGLESTEAKVTIPDPDLDWRRYAESPLADGSGVFGVRPKAKPPATRRPPADTPDVAA